MNKSGLAVGLAEQAQVFGEGFGGVPGAGMIVAEYPAAPDESVLVKLAGCLYLTEFPQVISEVAGGCESVRLVLA